MRGLDDLLSEKESGVWCSGDKINLLSGAYLLGRTILDRLDVSGPLDCDVCILRMHFFDLLAVRTAVVEWAVQWAVKKPLGRVQKAADYQRFLVWLCLEAPCLAGLFDPFAPLGAPGTMPVC